MVLTNGLLFMASTSSSVRVRGTITIFKSMESNDFQLNNVRKITPFVVATIEKFKPLELAEQDLKDRISAEVITCFKELADKPYLEIKEYIENYIFVIIQNSKTS